MVALHLEPPGTRQRYKSLQLRPLNTLVCGKNWDFWNLVRKSKIWTTWWGLWRRQYFSWRTVSRYMYTKRSELLWHLQHRDSQLRLMLLFSADQWFPCTQNHRGHDKIQKRYSSYPRYTVPHIVRMKWEKTNWWCWTTSYWPTLYLRNLLPLKNV